MLTPQLRNLLKTTYFYSEPELTNLEQVMGYTFPVHQFIEDVKKNIPYSRLHVFLQDLEKYFPLYKTSSYYRDPVATSFRLRLEGISTKYLGVEFILTPSRYTLHGIKEHKNLTTVREVIRELTFNN